MKCTVISFDKLKRHTTLQVGDMKIRGIAEKPVRGIVVVYPDHASRWHEPPFRLKLNPDGKDLRIATSYEHMPELRAP